MQVVGLRFPTAVTSRDLCAALQNGANRVVEQIQDLFTDVTRLCDALYYNADVIYWLLCVCVMLWHHSDIVFPRVLRRRCTALRSPRRLPDRPMVKELLLPPQTHIHSSWNLICCRQWVLLKAEKINCCLWSMLFRKKLTKKMTTCATKPTRVTSLDCRGPQHVDLGTIFWFLLNGIYPGLIFKRLILPNFCTNLYIKNTVIKHVDGWINFQRVFFIEVNYFQIKMAPNVRRILTLLWSHSVCPFILPSFNECFS